jgi:hypothetical protein
MADSHLSAAADLVVDALLPPDLVTLTMVVERA